MATQPIEASAPDIAGEIMLLPVHSIEVGDRLRPVDELWAKALGAVMLREGQHTPIEVHDRARRRDHSRRLAQRHQAGRALCAAKHLFDGDRSELIERTRTQFIGEGLGRWYRPFAAGCTLHLRDGRPPR
jgi:hypothetical protein